MLSAFTASMGAYMAAYIGLLLLASAAHKIADPVRAGDATRSLLGVPEAWVKPAWMTAAALETCAAVAVLSTGARHAGAIMAATLWAGYVAAILTAALRGKIVDCGCSFGGGRAHSVTASLGRSAALLVLALVLAVTHLVLPAQALGILALLGGCALLVLHVAFDLTHPATRGAASQ